MKLLDTILFSLAVTGVIIGVHQTFTVGFMQSYWIFMLVIVLLMWYKLRQNKTAEARNSKPEIPPAKPTVGKAKPKSGKSR